MTEIKKLTPEELQANKDRYIKAVTSTGREGINEFLAWLETTDFYSAGCHDLCKVNTYKKAFLKSGEFKGEYKVIDDSGLNLGHGEKSVVMALQSGLKLLPEELSAIRWHMGLWDAGAREDYPSGFAFKACHGTWLGRLLSTSDYEAALLEKC